MRFGQVVDAARVRGAPILAGGDVEVHLSVPDAVDGPVNGVVWLENYVPA